MSKETTGRKKGYKELESERIRQEVEGKIIITNQGYEVRLNKYNNCF